MIERNDLLSLAFYQKSIFTGSVKGMRYSIKKEKKEDQDCFLVSVWPGPYIASKTDSSLIQQYDFQFSNDGLEEITQFLNQELKKKTEQVT